MPLFPRSAALVGGALTFALLPLVGIAQTIPDYCMQGPYGYNVRTSMSNYPSGETVNFCLRDDTRDPMFLGTTNPWVIQNDRGEIVFRPPAGTAGTEQTGVYIGAWDGRDTRGNVVTPGTYFIVFTVNGIQSSASIALESNPLSFSSSDPHTSEPVNITQGQSGQVNQIIYSNNSRPVTVLIDMEIKDKNNQKVGQAFYDQQFFNIGANQLYSLPIPSTLPVGDYTVDVGFFYPGWNGLIQWISTVHVFHVVAGSGQTSSGPAMTATIEPQHATVRAATNLDFVGRSFGSEETVTVTSDGMTVAIAHADGGGNFSTGSIPVPAAVGEKTYVFTGSNSHITLSATVSIVP